MNYYELSFTTLTTEDYQRDLLIDALAGIGFDTFEETEFGFKAYIPQTDFGPDRIEKALSEFRQMFSFSYETELIPQKNWNEVWESNFEPIIIDNEIYVRATFHEPQSQYRHEIIIDPKMAFGTGHHQTTSMMLQWMLETNFAGKNVLDMGCGTGILAIMASKLGATAVTAIDYDPVCYESAIENAAINHIENIALICGSKELIPDEKYDIILANINRNILLEQLERYAQASVIDSELYLSGFYEEPDLAIIKTTAAESGFEYARHKKDGDWAAARFVKRK